MNEKLRRAEGRVAALEKELLDNTRRWARDKAELQVKLYSAQGGWAYPFGREVFEAKFALKTSLATSCYFT